MQFEAKALPQLFRCKRIFGALAVCLSLLPILSHADEITVAGVRIPVTEMRTVEGNTVKLVIGGTAEILPLPQAELKAIEVTFSDPAIARRFPLSALTALAINLAPRGAESNHAMSEVLGAWLGQAASIDRSARIAAIAELLANPTIVAFLNTTPITGFLDNEPGLDLVADLATRDPTTFGLRAAGIDPKLRLGIADRLRALALSAASLRDFERATRAGRALLTLQTDDTAKSLAVFIQRLRESIETPADPAQGDTLPYRFFELYDSTTDEQFREVLYPFLTDAVHRFAAQFVEDGRVSQALPLLARIPVKKSTPTTHRLLLDALTRLGGPDAIPALSERSVSQFLISWSAVDQGIAEASRAAVLRIGRAECETGDPAHVSGLLALYRLEDSDADALMRAQVFGYLKRGQDQSARETAKRMKRYSLIDSIQFLAYGLYGGTVAFVCYGISLILLLTLLVLKIRSRAKSSSDDSKTESAEPAQVSSRTIPPDSDQQDDAPEIQGGFAVNKSRMLSPLALEYRKLLATFGLEATASLKEIKQAYRTKVKAVHPDLNPNLSEEKRTEFVEVTQKYERLLALRDELGM